MSELGGTLMEIGDKLSDLIVDHAEWSQRIFGPSSSSGPIGAFRHLQKEAQEAIDSVEKDDPAALKKELADCLVLLLDASRRSGVKVVQLIEAAQAKMVENKARKWPERVPFVFYTEHDAKRAHPYVTRATRHELTIVFGHGMTAQESVIDCKRQLRKRATTPIEHIRD